MALEKVVYEDKKTVISAKNLNDIQDAIIDLERNKGKLLGRLELNSGNCVSEIDGHVWIEFNEELEAQVQELLTACKEASGCLSMKILAYDVIFKANASYGGQSDVIGFAENIAAAVVNTEMDGLELIRIGRSWMESTNTLFHFVLAGGKPFTIEVYET